MHIGIHISTWAEWTAVNASQVNFIFHVNIYYKAPYMYLQPNIKLMLMF